MSPLDRVHAALTYLCIAATVGLASLALGAPLSAQALSEDFNWSTSQQFPPAGWTTFDAGTAPYAWGEASLALPNSAVYMGQAADAAAHDYSPQGTLCDSWLVSPMMDLRGYATPRLRFDSEVFWVNFMAHYPGSVHDGRSTVEISVDGGISWAEAWTEGALVNGATALELDLTPISGLPSVQLGFRYRGSFAHAWSVDAVRVDNGGQPVGPGVAVLGDCPGLTVLRATGMTPGGPIAVYVAAGPGATVLGGGACAGLLVPALAPTRLPVGAQIADTNGLLVVQGALPAAACGSWWLGVVDLAGCSAPAPVAL